MDSRLTALQQRVLVLLAGLEPKGVLTGGGALAGFYLGHRATRDLDLLWTERSELEHLPDDAVRILQLDGLSVDVLQRSPSFVRLRIGLDQDSLVVDLVADPASPLYVPAEGSVHGTTVRMDTPREILANKLCTLLSRSEPRDLWDVYELLRQGYDLHAALADAPAKDGGFSPLVLAWVLRDLAIENLAERVGIASEVVEELAEFKSALVEQLARAGRPEDTGD